MAARDDTTVASAGQSSAAPSRARPDSCDHALPRTRSRPMTDQTPDPSPTNDAAHDAADDAKSAAPVPRATATGILESLGDAIDDLVERAGPTVKTYSAKAADVAASAADKAAPYARKAGAPTAGASPSLAAKPREFAADLRSQLDRAEDAAKAAGDHASGAAGGAADAVDRAAGGTSDDIADP